MKNEFDTPLFAQAMAACTDGLVIADATAQGMPLVYVNAAFERLTGYCARDVLGSNCRFLQRGDTDQLAVRLPAICRANAPTFVRYSGSRSVRSI